MGFNEAARPSDHRLVSTGKYHNIFMSTESVSFTLTAGSADHYEVRDYYGTVVRTGPVSGTSLDIGTMPLGWFKLYLIRPTAAAAPWLLAGGETHFVVTRPGLGLPDRPADGSFFGQDPAGEGLDYPAGGFTRMGPYRHTLHVGATHASDLSKCLSDTSLEASTWGAPDPQRPLVPIAAYRDGIGSADDAAVTSAVSQLVSAGCSVIEAKNEPNVGITDPAVYIASEYSNFSARVRAGGGLVGGPCTISVDGTIDTDMLTGGEWLRRFFAAGGGALTDVFTFHNYNGVFGSLRVGRQTLDGLVALLTRYGQQAKPRFDTEAFSYFAHVYGSSEVRLQTQQTLLEMHMLEQYGIPKERTCNFYAQGHGFWGYPSFWINHENAYSPNPVVAVVRVWSQELVNKAYAARLDFGSENDQMLGCRFTGPAGSVVTFQSDSREATIKFTVTGASAVDTVDAWGNVTNRPVVGGVISVPVDGLPGYIRCPLGVIATPVAADYGVDVTGPQAYLTQVSAPAPEPGFPVTAPLDVLPTTYKASVGSSLPADWVMTFPRVTRFDRVLVRTTVPWQNDAGLLDFDVDAKVGGSWVTLATITEPTNTLTWASHGDVGRGFTDSYYSRKSCFVVHLDAAVAATDIRIHVRDATYGGGATLATTNGGGQSTDTGQTGPRRLCLSVVRAYLSTQSDGGTATAGQPMLLIT